MTLFRFSAVGAGDIYLREPEAKRFLQMGDEFYDRDRLTLEIPDGLMELSQQLFYNSLSYGGNPIDMLLLEYLKYIIEEARN